MAATIGSVNVNLVAQTAKFVAGMDRAKAKLKSFGQSFLTVAGATGVGLFVKRMLEAMDVAGKLADRLQITTEALTSLRFSAALAGVDTAGFDKAMEILVRRLGEVRMGTGEAIDALKAIGVSADEAVAMSPDQLFLKIADAIAETPLAADKAAIAYKLFGRQGQSLLNMLNQGSEAIAKQQKRAFDLGLTFRRSMAAAAERANDAFSELFQSIVALGRDIVVRFAPAIERVSKALSQVVIWLRAADRALGGWLLKLAAFVGAAAVTIFAILAIAKAVRVLIAAWQALIKVQVIATALQGPKGIATLVAGLAVAGVVIFALNSALDETLSELDEMTKEANEAAAAFEGLASEKMAASNIGGSRNLFEVGTAESVSFLSGLKREELGMERIVLELREIKRLEQEQRDLAEAAARRAESRRTGTIPFEF